MKVYSSYRKKNAQAPNTMKSEMVVNRQRSADKSYNSNKQRRREVEPRDTWTDLVARRMQILGEKLSGFFYPEVVE